MKQIIPPSFSKVRRPYTCNWTLKVTKRSFQIQLKIIVDHCSIVPDLHSENFVSILVQQFIYGRKFYAPFLSFQIGNISYKKFAYCSQHRYTKVSELTDGELRLPIRGLCAAKSYESQSIWWKVDLENMYVVQAVRMFVVQSDINGYQVEIMSSSNHTINCNHLTDAYLTSTGEIYIECSVPHPSRYTTVIKRTRSIWTEYLCLREIQIVGYLFYKCEDSSYGPGCKRKCNCDNCDVVDGKCEGNCHIGWKGESCSTPCSDGKFGEGCMYRCRCRRHTHCNHISGSCAMSGCKDGWYGKGCQSATMNSIRPTLRLKDSSTFTVSFPKWPGANEDKSRMTTYKVQYRISNLQTNWNTFSSNLSNSVNRVYDIDVMLFNLYINSVYEVRVMPKLHNNSTILPSQRNFIRFGCGSNTTSTTLFNGQLPHMVVPTLASKHLPICRNWCRCRLDDSRLCLLTSATCYTDCNTTDCDIQLPTLDGNPSTTNISDTSFIIYVPNIISQQSNVETYYSIYIENRTYNCSTFVVIMYLKPETTYIIEIVASVKYDKKIYDFKEMQTQVTTTMASHNAISNLEINKYNTSSSNCNCSIHEQTRAQLYFKYLGFSAMALIFSTVISILLLGFFYVYQYLRNKLRKQITETKVSDDLILCDKTKSNIIICRRCATRPCREDIHRKIDISHQKKVSFRNSSKYEEIASEFEDNQREIFIDKDRIAEDFVSEQDIPEMSTEENSAENSTQVNRAKLYDDEEESLKVSMLCLECSQNEDNFKLNGYSIY